MQDKDSVVSLLWANYKIIIIAFAILITVIPIGSYAISWRIRASQSGERTEYDRAVTLESTASARKSKTVSNLGAASGTPADSTEEDKSGAEASAKVSFGPTMDFGISIEGRPKDNFSTKLFVGIAEGKPVATPKYLLQFNVDMPKTGIFTGMSLQGLDQGKTYSAYLKGPAQIATASAFILSPTVNRLNSGSALQLLTGDLNEDNTINTADYSIAKSALGSTTSFANWNANIDFNLDGIINVLDLAYVTKNFGKSGLSGIWYSPNPPATGGLMVSSFSASIRVDNPDSGYAVMPGSTGSSNTTIPLPPIEGSGYWIWVAPQK